MIGKQPLTYPIPYISRRPAQEEEKNSEKMSRVRLYHHPWAIASEENISLVMIIA